jgi:hypothetical protein
MGDDQVVMLATHTFRPEANCVCVCQPGTGSEVLLTGLARRVWEMASARRGINVGEMCALLAEGGADPAETRAVLAYLVNLRLLELGEAPAW